MMKELEMKMSERCRKLKGNVQSKACSGGGYVGDIQPDVERAWLWTQSYKETESGENGKPIPEVIRRAKALEKTLKEMTIYIQDDELVVGNNTPAPNLLYLSPEISLGTIQEAIDDGYFSGEAQEDDRKKLAEMMEFWKGKTTEELCDKKLTDHERLNVKAGAPVISITHVDGAQHCVPNWEHLFTQGVSNIVSNIKSLEKEWNDKNAEENPLYPAMLICLDALVHFSNRYSTLASEKAAEIEKLIKETSSTSDELRRRHQELLQIAETTRACFSDDKVGDDFRRTLQEYFLVHLILQYIDRAGFGSLARIDQIWWSGYRKQVLEDKILSREEAREHLCCLFIKMLDLGYWFPRVRRLHFSGNSLLQTLTVGGVNAKGEDACNDLTELVLEAARITRSNQPTFNFRYHPKAADSAVESAIEVVKAGMGMPAFLHDEVMQHSLIDQGVPKSDAWDWAVVGCVSACSVRNQTTTKRLAQSNVTAKCLELALNDGKCALTQKQLGPKTGTVDQFKTFEAVVEAFRIQVGHSFEVGVHVRNLSRELEAQILQRPMASALHITPPIEGKDVSQYEDYPNLWINCVGMVDVVDSLINIKKMCFEDEMRTLEDFANALTTNWGYGWEHEKAEERKPVSKELEIFRKMCIHKTPKFGNDDEYADSIGHLVFKLVAEEARKVKDVNGGTYRILPQSVSLYVSTGKHVAGLPNGRIWPDFLADGGASPTHGMDVNGPSAVLKSVSKLDHKLTKGILLNQRWMPEALEGEEGMARFKSYLKTWYELGLSQIQFNVVSNEVLIKAQKEPEKYSDVIVRVAGYSAYFTQLSKDVQDAIIRRKEQNICNAQMLPTLQMEVKRMDGFKGYKTLLVSRECDGGVIDVVLNRPDKLNSINDEMIWDLHRFLDSLLFDDSKIVVISGSGRSFCAGADMSNLSIDHQHSFKNQVLFSSLISKIRNSPQVFIASVNGNAFGGGLSIALACDMRIASHDASFSCAFLKVGLSGCEMGCSFFLPRIVGLGMASEMMLTGCVVHAIQAKKIGLVNECVGKEDLHKESMSLAEKLNGLSDLQLRTTKQGINAGISGIPLESQIAFEDRQQVMTANDPESRSVGMAHILKFLKSKM